MAKRSNDIVLMGRWINRPEQIDIVEDGQDSILAKPTICALYNMKKTILL